MAVAVPGVLARTAGVAVAAQNSVTSASTAAQLRVIPLLAALRGYAGCEVLAVSNWLLRRNDQRGSAGLWPIEHLERH